MTLGKVGMQIQVLGPGLAQMPAPQAPAPAQTQVKKNRIRSKLHTPRVTVVFISKEEFNSFYDCCNYRQQQLQQ